MQKGVVLSRPRVYKCALRDTCRHAFNEDARALACLLACLYILRKRVDQQTGFTRVCVYVRARV